MSLETELLESQPLEIFRYAPLKDPERIEQLKDVLTKNRLWCADPETFNDPFDLRPYLPYDTPEFRSEYFEYFRALAKSQNRAESGGELNDLIEKAYLGFLTHSSPISRLHDLIRKGGICCLTETGNNLLMWAHYTSGHNGYCLKFRSPNWSTDHRVIAYNVEYGENYPTVNILRPYFENLKPESERNYYAHYEFTKAAALRKSSHWEYEKEWRIIRPEPGYVNFEAKNLVEIVFGVAVPDKIVSEITEVIQKRGSPIKVFKATLAQNTFNINYIPIV